LDQNIKNLKKQGSKLKNEKTLWTKLKNTPHIQLKRINMGCNFFYINFGPQSLNLHYLSERYNVRGGTVKSQIF